MGIGKGLLMHKSMNIGAGDNEQITSSKQFAKVPGDPEKTQTALISDLRVATDKFFMGNENFLSDLAKDVSQFRLMNVC